jgi:hypothetical protein
VNDDDILEFRRDLEFAVVSVSDEVNRERFVVSESGGEGYEGLSLTTGGLVTPQRGII